MESNPTQPARPIPPASSASGATLAATDLARLGPRASWRGRYVILRPHARGGLGTVSVALDETLGRKVALKQMRTDLADVPQFRERFIYEAEITGQLEHPGIIPIYALGQDEHGRPYYAMKFVEGRTLDEAIAEYHAQPRPIVLRDLLGRFVEVCNAIAYAHSQGIVHRDIKPSNIMLGKFGETVILDWGLAKRTGPATHDQTIDGAAAAGQVTPGKPVGTPAFMPPEQAAGRADVGPAADVYSLGAVLYQLLCGRAPYGGADSASVVAQVMQGPAPRAASVKRVAPALDAVCARAMSRDARLRPSAAELAREVERWFADEPLASYRGTPLDAALRWARRHRTLSIAAVSVLVAIIVGLSIGTVLITREKDAKDLALRDKAAALARAEEQRLLAEKGRLDTRRLLCAAHMRAAIKVWADGHASRAFELLDAQLPTAGEPDFRGFEWYYLLDQMQGARHAELAPEGGVVGAVAFAPDGSALAAGTRGGSASIWDLATRRIRMTLAPAAAAGAGAAAGRVWSVAFARDGTSLAVGSADGKVRLWDCLTGQLRFVLDAHGAAVTGLAFAPDGATLASGGDGGLTLWDLARRAPRAHLPHAHAKGNVYCAYAPDGATLATAGADGAVRLWDARSAAPLRTLTTFAFPVSCVTFAPDGRQLAAGSSWSVKVFDVASGGELRKVEHMGGVTSAAFAPDGRRLTTGSGSGQIIVTELATGAQVTYGQRHSASSLCFAPDGRTFASLDDSESIGLWDATPAPQSLGEEDHPALSSAFVDEHTLVAGTRSGLLQVWDVRSGALTATRRADAPVKYVAAHPHAPLLCAGDAQGGVSFWDVRTWTRRGGSTSAHQASVTCVAASPDGARFVTADAQRLVRLWDARTGEPIKSLPDTGTVAAFAPGNANVLAVGDPYQRVALWSIDTGAPAEPLKVASGDYSALCFASDGSSLAIGTRGSRGLVWDFAKGAPGYHLRSEGWSVSSILLHPDGQTMVTTNPYGSVQFFDARTGEERATFEVSVLDGPTIAMSPSGRTLATIGRDGRARLWRAASSDR